MVALSPGIEQMVQPPPVRGPSLNRTGQAVEAKPEAAKLLLYGAVFAVMTLN